MSVLLRPHEIAILFAIGAAGGLIGDAGNVQSGATVYLDHTTPYIWESPLWFPVMVGLGTVAVGLTRVLLGPTRDEGDFRLGVAAWCAVVAIYALTSVVGDDGTQSVTLIWALGVLVACLLVDSRAGLICAILAALVGPLVEVAVVELELSEYSGDNDAYLGVALWLPGLYFAFGAAVARITELLVAARR